MRILVVSRHFHENVETMVHGVFKRFQMLLEAISDIARIDLLYYVSPDIDISTASIAQFETSLSNHFRVPIHLSFCPLNHGNGFLSKIMRYGKGVFFMVHQPVFADTAGVVQIKAMETCLERKPSAVLVHRLGVMSPFLLTRKKLPPVFFDLDDIEHLVLKQRIRCFPKIRSKLGHLILYPALCRGEKEAILSAQSTFVCSDNDLEYLTDRLGAEGLVKIPNAITIPPVQDITTKPNLLFLGTYLFQPNVDAAEFLIREIWPIIRAKVPSAKLSIAGAHPERISGYHAGLDGVIFTGFIKSIEEIYRETRVVCVPVLSGSGTRVKILEAAAFGKPIVSTAIGAEGIEMRDGRDILIQDDPEAFADACTMLLDDHDKCKKIGRSGRKMVMENYDKKIVKEKIKKTILQVIMNA